MKVQYLMLLNIIVINIWTDITKAKSVAYLGHNPWLRREHADPWARRLKAITNNLYVLIIAMYILMNIKFIYELRIISAPIN